MEIFDIIIGKWNLGEKNNRKIRLIKVDIDYWSVSDWLKNWIKKWIFSYSTIQANSFTIFYHFGIIKYQTDPIYPMVVLIGPNGIVQSLAL